MTGANHETDASGAFPSGHRMRLLVGALVLLLVVAVVVGWLRLQDHQRLVDAAQDAEAAGREAATNMLTYDYQTLDEDFAWVERDGTDAFEEAFQASVDNVREVAESTSAVSEAEILGSGVHLEGDDAATVLVAVDSTITKATGLPIEERWRVSLELVLEDGRWLVDEIQLL